MELYNNKQEFLDAVAATSDYYKVSMAIIEKDYYVTLLLRMLADKIPGLLFKGGTSLSKCFKVIKRFSEDIDLTLDTTHFSQSNKRKANKAVIDVCDSLGFPIINRNQVEMHGHGNYNCYDIEYPVTYSDSGVNPFIKIELVFIQKAYPDSIKPVCSMIGEYLTEINQQNLLPQYNLNPYDIKVQSLERTFVDKVFAVCDYYLQNEVTRQSRHLYDIKKLMDVIDWQNTTELIDDVRSDRSSNKRCMSAKPEISVSEILMKIILEEYYKKDYEEVTESLLAEKITYNDAIASIEAIVQKRLFK